jgi:NTE family protein
MTKSVGLVLGSGGARGWAHIGVIQALEEANIRVSYIAGASIGALVGSMYAAGELRDLEEFVRSLDWRTVVSYFDIVFPRSGLLDGNRVYELLSQHLRDMKIEDAEVEFCCVATDLLSGKEVRLQSGAMVDAVRASISIPGVFTPFQKGDRFFGDGGIINPIPVDVAKDMGAEVIIAVNLNHVAPTATPALSDETALRSESDDSDPEMAHQPSAEPQSTDKTLPENSLDQDGQSDRPASQVSDSDVIADEKQDNDQSSKATEGMTGDGDAQSEEQMEGNETSNPNSDVDASFVQTLQSTSVNAQSRISVMMNQIQERYEDVQDQVQNKLETWMPERKEELNIFDVIGTSLNVMEQQVAKSRLDVCPPDLLIEPDLGEYGIFDFHQADAIIQEGYRCMKERIPDLQEILSDD